MGISRIFVLLGHIARAEYDLIYSRTGTKRKGTMFVDSSKAEGSSERTDGKSRGKKEREQKEKTEKREREERGMEKNKIDLDKKGWAIV